MASKFLRGQMANRPFIATTSNQPQLVLPADGRRAYLLIQNNSNGVIWIGLDSGPTSQGASLVLGPGNFWEPVYVPTNAIYVRSATLAGAAGVALFAVED